MSASVTADSIALFLPSLAGGGAERVFVQLANEFARLGLRVDLVLASARGPYLGEIAPAVRLIDLRAGGVMAALPKLVRYLRVERPAVMLSALDHANVVAVAASRLAGGRTRCVVSMRSVASAVFDREGSFRSWIVLQLMKRAYPMADAIIANSHVAAADVARLLRGDGKLTTIHNPLNLEWIEALSREPVDHPWCSPGMPLVVSVGSLTAQGLSDVGAGLRARPASARLSSGHPRRRSRARQDRSRRPSVGRDRGRGAAGIPGQSFRVDAPCAVFVSSSLTEGCPNALMQALACGTRVVSTDCVGGSAEILQQGKWGRLVPTGDPCGHGRSDRRNAGCRRRSDVRHRARDFAHIASLASIYGPVAARLRAASRH